jgi:peptidoglycan/LPS O-acetylase OafA/YrhL
LSANSASCGFVENTLIEPSNKKTHIRFLDGLRAIAVLLVIGAHAKSSGFLPSGIPLPDLGGFNLGVMLFYFISGFVLFYPYAQHLFENKPQQTLARYFERRMLKILPSYWLVLSTMAVLSLVDFSNFNDPTYNSFRHSLLANYLKHFFLIHNFWDSTFTSIDASYWSIAIEAQFYLFFPFIAWAFMRAPLKTMLSLIMITVTYHMVIRHMGVDSQFVYYAQLPSFLCLFGVGSLAAYIMVRNRSMGKDTSKRQKERWMLVTCLAGLLTYGLFGAMLFILIFDITRADPILPRLFEGSLLLWFSRISYNLYLWNQDLLMLYQHHIASRFVGMPYGNILSAVTAFFLVIGVAWMVTRWIEEPILRGGFQATRRLFGQEARSNAS